jgi:hypothetical protein
MVWADTRQAKKQLKLTQVCGVVGPIRNPTRTTRLEVLCEIRGLSIQKKLLVIRCAIKSKQNK